MRLEAYAKCRGKVDQERHEAFADCAPRRLCIHDDVREKALHSLHTKTGQDFAKTLRGTLSVYARSVRLESTEKTRDEIGEVNLSKTLDEGTQRLRGSGTGFGDRIDQDHMEHGQEPWKIRDEVLGIGERGEVTDDSSSLLLGVRTTLA
jgi:hypothetical protein